MDAPAQNMVLDRIRGVGGGDRPLPPLPPKLATEVLALMLGLPTAPSPPGAPMPTPWGALIDAAVRDHRPGPDERDDPDWDRLTDARQRYLLLAGRANARMEDYHAQIAAKSAHARSQLEQWTLLGRTILSVLQDAPPPVCDPPAPPGVDWRPFALWAAAATVACVGLLLLLSRRNGWRHPFSASPGPLTPGAWAAPPPPAGAGRG